MTAPLMSVSMTGAEVLEARLARIPGLAREAIRKSVERQTLALEAHIKEHLLSGQVLKARTGTLRRSITSKVEETATSITGRVGTNLRYGLAHEYGATIQIPEIRPINAKALHFTAGGQDVFAMRARAHQVVLPERSFLRRGLRERRQAFLDDLRSTLQAVFRE